VLRIPQEYLHSVARCGKCHKTIRIFKVTVSDDAVANWLSRDIDEEETIEMAQEQGQPAAQLQGVHAASAQTASGQAALGQAAQGAHAGQVALGDHGHAVAFRPGQNLRLVKVDHKGVLFEFPASRLLDSHFRLAMPRSCLHCGTRAHLQAHVIIFAGQLRDSISLEAEHAAGSLVVSADEIKRLSDQDFLARLPHVPNMPHPFNAPMPYWLCDMCNAAGAISGQIEVNQATRAGHCQLLIRNLRRSMEFMAGAGGHDDPQYQKLAKLVLDTGENPWDLLSIVVQHRVQQWFHPRAGEAFVAYVPDRDRTRTEDGMAGILITNQRMIHHIAIRHQETPVDRPLWIQLATAGVRAKLNLKTPTWELKQFTMDRPGMDVLRRGLTLAKFKTTWA
jgi:hypothetical protein